MLSFFDFFKLPEGYSIPKLSGFLYLSMSQLQRWYLVNCKLPKYGINNNKRKQQIIISLTTYPERINTAYYAIKSIMLQKFKADKIILWLSNEEFLNVKIPISFNELIKKGLEIRYCENLYSHKKYYYVLQEQKNDLIVTYDDDLIYPEDSLWKLYDTYLKFPDCIICNRGPEIRLSPRNEILPYEKWKFYSSVGVMTPTFLIMPSTGAGVLYPPNSISKEVYNIDAMKHCAYNADDLWMKTMSLLNNTKIVKTTKYVKALTLIDKKQGDSLADINCLGGGNNIAIKRLQQYYHNAFERLRIK